MVLDMNDLVKDKTFPKRKFGHIENHREPENPSVGLLKEKLNEQQIILMELADSDYLNHLNSSCMSIHDDAQHALIVKDVGDDTQHESAFDDVGYDPEHQLPVEDVGKDPQYALFLSRLKEYGSSFMLEADETLGLTKPLIYEEDESIDKGQEDLDSRFLIQRRESEIDHDYESFLASLRFEGPTVIYRYGNGPSVVFDSLDLPNLQKEKSRDIVSYPFPTKRKICSKFRVRIMRILSKPYEKGEHEKLKEAITLRRPQNRHIDLRSERVRFSASDKKGKSYLDHHADLKRKVQAAEGDVCKQLNLLRGFFFWIQNLTQEGSFIPWKDEECLAVRPQSC